MAEIQDTTEFPQSFSTSSPEAEVQESAPRPVLSVPGAAVGRRKQAIARVRLIPGAGTFTVNGRTLEDYFPNKLHQQLINDPFTVLNLQGAYDVIARISGGGDSGQAGALRLGIARALYADPAILFMDEATSGLDPVVRDDILDLFLEFVQEEDHAILVSSHITSDLEKVADYIVFLHQGRVVFCKPKDELRYRYGVLRCGQAQFADLGPADMVACRRQDYEWEVLVADRDAARRKYPKAVVDPATMDEIMLLYVKGERR